MLLFIAVILLYNVLLFYIGWNGWKWLQTIIKINKPFKYIYWFLFFLLGYSPILKRFLEDYFNLTWVGAIWLGLFYFLIFLLPLANLFVFLMRFTNIQREKVTKRTGFAVMAIVCCLFIYGAYNAYTPVVRTYEINIPKHVEGKKEFNIVMASDMHFGVLSGSKHAENLVKEINSLNPDFVLFPGDIIDDDLNMFLAKGIPPILKQIKAPVYMSLGNHDREVTEELMKSFRESGMDVLFDEVLVLDNGITLVGRKDKGYREEVRLKLNDLMKNVDLNKPVILMDHQPYDFDIAEENGVDLLVSGHTHRGQIAPGHLITQKIYENDWGYLRKGNLHTIVSSGYGFWGTPIRIGSQSEIVQIHATFK
ncbi:metallophosphoesterase [Metabacillus fastidiosus]|uniref:Metallophosphoesterase n=1 Tax=Metabacillus fastidiosus TaxID=1458 RepID=A0ABU6P2R2_9BACI|nr:metallophosphoesterase [Metabacillus fastidiosus]